MLFFEKQTVPDFLALPGQHVRLPVQTPRRINFEYRLSAHVLNYREARSGCLERARLVVCNVCKSLKQNALCPSIR